MPHTKHTPGRLLHWPHDLYKIAAPDLGLLVADCYPETLGTGLHNADRDTNVENARRLVACWNACEGVPTEALRPGLVSRALAVCKEIADSGCDLKDSERRLRLYHVLHQAGLL